MSEASVKPSKEQKYYDALKRIPKYEPPEKIKRNCERDYGLDDANEAIEMAYENVIWEAQKAVKGMRRPVK